MQLARLFIRPALYKHLVAPSYLLHRPLPQNLQGFMARTFSARTRCAAFRPRQSGCKCSFSPWSVTKTCTGGFSMVVLHRIASDACASVFVCCFFAFRKERWNKCCSAAPMSAPTTTPERNVESRASSNDISMGLQCGGNCTSNLSQHCYRTGHESHRQLTPRSKAAP